MHRPVLVTPPSLLPVSLAEAKAHLRVSVSDEDGLIGGLISAATEHLDGWTGILGRCLVEQVWRQDFDRFARCLTLPLGPVLSIGSVTWRNQAGQVATIAGQEYALKTDAGGRSEVRFRDSWSMPSGLHETGAVSVTYTAGYPIIPEVPADGDTPAVPARSTVPEPIRAAILLLVGAWYENREETAIGVSVTALPNSVAVSALLAPYRRVGL
jgi:uncharacterized phiE125 gp8 family phage protein